ncbi:MAG: hypothetical protein IPH74_15595 [Bacteroidetes bacterium]|nr:hypothetical protein [Bacteroidota bacterium]
MKGEGTGVNGHAASIFAGPDIRIWKMENGSNKTTTRLYGTTVHELGHSSHRSLGIGKYIFCSVLFSESYADMVEWLFCSNKYFPSDLINSSNASTNFYDHKYVEYIFRINSNNTLSAYTPLFIDLLDNDENNTKGKNSIIIQENLKFNPLIIREYFKR